MFQKRVVILGLLLTCCVGALVMRVGHLQFALGEHYRDLASSYPVRVRFISSLRGSIITSDGVVLAEDRAAYDLAVEGPRKEEIAGAEAMTPARPSG